MGAFEGGQSSLHDRERIRAVIAVAGHLACPDTAVNGKVWAQFLQQST